MTPVSAAHKALGAYRQAVEAVCLSAAKFHADVVSAGEAATSLHPFLGDGGAELVAIAWKDGPPVAEWAAKIPAVTERVKDTLKGA
jgi:hypothetical protein